ncbi:MAG: AAA family ATPase, partial [Methanosarcinales archaeon]
MNSILISSSEAYSGKSAICMGIGSILKEKGYKVGYMKPIGNLLRDVNGIIMDEDVKNVMYT